ncbi:hypothetical protein K474DRAFT_793255 [Panus rudis PR-1116 ss-1]|nr:hypothetical protein K474DRAFT_793255 [Panus rudis PR-1116 ss-1]
MPKTTKGILAFGLHFLLGQVSRGGREPLNRLDNHQTKRQETSNASDQGQRMDCQHQISLRQSFPVARVTRPLLDSSLSHLAAASRFYAIVAQGGVLASGRNDDGISSACARVSRS